MKRWHFRRFLKPFLSRWAGLLAALFCFVLAQKISI